MYNLVMTGKLHERQPIPDNLKLLYEVCLERNRMVGELPSSVIAIFESLMDESIEVGEDFLKDASRTFSAIDLTFGIMYGAVFHKGSEDTLVNAKLFEQLGLQEFIGNSILQQRFTEQGVHIDLEEFKTVSVYVSEGLNTLYGMGYLGCIVDPHGYNAITMVETDNPVELYYTL